MYKDEDTLLTNLKLTCTKCGWEGMSQDTDKVPDTRGDGVWQVCPLCRTPEHFALAPDGSDYRLQVALYTQTSLSKYSP